MSVEDLRQELISEIIKIRQEQGVSQKTLEELSGVRQPVIARIEKGTSIPNLDTLVKILQPLGYKVVVVPLE